MSKSKKIAQAARREARDAMLGYRTALIGKLSVFNDILKPRPKFIPNFIWRWISGKVIDVEKMQKFLSPNQK